MNKSLSRVMRFAISAASVCMLAGCNVAGVLADRTVGTTVNAKYVPKKSDSMLVLVESYGLSMDSGVETQHMTLVLRKKLVDQKIASLVDEQSVERLRDNPREYAPMTIADIGRKVGARQVLYVNVWHSEIVKPPGSGQMRGHMEAVVKVVDSATGETRWPNDGPSESVQITTGWIPESANKTENDLRAQMSEEMAADIGKLFHNYHPDQQPMENQSLD